MAIQFGEGLSGSDFVSIFCVWEHVYVLRLQILCLPVYIHMWACVCIYGHTHMLPELLGPLGMAVAVDLGVLQLVL